MTPVYGLTRAHDKNILGITKQRARGSSAISRDKFMADRFIQHGMALDQGDDDNESFSAASGRLSYPATKENEYGTSN
jgi:hypothetical protein